MRTLIALTLAVIPAAAADLDALMPASTDQITHVNVKRAVQSPLARDYLKKEITEQLAKTDAPKWMKDAGFDMWKDLDTVTTSMSPPKFEKKDGKMVQTRKPASFVVARGRFDGQKLMDVVDTLIGRFGDKVSVIKEKDVKLVKVLTGGVDKDEAMYATLVNENLLVAGSSKDEVLAAVKADETNADAAEVKKELADLVKSLDDKAVFYQAMLLDGKEIAATMQDVPLVDDQAALKKQVEAIVSYSFTARAAGDIQMAFSLNFKTREDSGAFHESAKEMIEKGKVLLPLVGGGAKEAKGILDDLKKSLKAKCEGTIVTASARISGDAIKQAIGVED
jgi:hypothetical protein